MSIHGNLQQPDNTVLCSKSEQPDWIYAGARTGSWKWMPLSAASAYWNLLDSRVRYAKNMKTEAKSAAAIPRESWESLVVTGRVPTPEERDLSNGSFLVWSEYSGHWMPARNEHITTKECWMPSPPPPFSQEVKEKFNSLPVEPATKLEAFRMGYEKGRLP